MKVFALIIDSREDDAEVHLYQKREDIIDDFRDFNYELIYDEDDVETLDRDSMVELNNGTTVIVRIKELEVR